MRCAELQVQGAPQAIAVLSLSPTSSNHFIHLSSSVKTKGERHPTPIYPLSAWSFTVRPERARSERRTDDSRHPKYIVSLHRRRLKGRRASEPSTSSDHLHAQWGHLHAAGHQRPDDMPIGWMSCGRKSWVKEGGLPLRLAPKTCTTSLQSDPAALHLRPMPRCNARRFFTHCARFVC